MFSELESAEAACRRVDSDGSILDRARGHARRPTGPPSSRITSGTSSPPSSTAPPTDFEPDDMLDDIGLDSMMAMEFRVRINMMFSIDLPVLEILRGVSVNSLADRVLAELHTIHGDVPADVEDVATAAVCRRRRRRPTRWTSCPMPNLRELLAELEAEPE